MIDLHNHLLPGLDDGAPDLESALALARLAVADGVSHMVCTPHLHAGRYDNTRADIEAARTLFVEVLQQNGIVLQVAAAAEVRIGIEVIGAIEQGALPFVGRWEGRNVLLLELPHGDIPLGTERLTSWLLQHQVVPMIAHPERNKAVMRNPSRLKPFIEQGCLLQLTASSLTGYFGPAAQALSHSLLVDGHASILASDGHNVQHRPPLLGEGLRQATLLIGERRAQALVEQTPWAIAQGLFQ
ncbi:tyrosine-protein phosphatase [Pseudomonas simiae]|jgi:protein-tyrosine phosphatase|uniref:protein-tyrosine-phosphatase n=1 Tax=Pseudomonas simiae TaxID=321846 RepID=A0A1N7ULJ0_9PSED|nr:CpsB/CapC family capsule biosynthesis tyrosine phosphatase [Pseudomonas simiae]AIB38798.1 capsular biosynthesis protein [Pseudomonas simiae]